MLYLPAPCVTKSLRQANSCEPKAMSLAKKFCNGCLLQPCKQRRSDGSGRLEETPRRRSYHKSGKPNAGFMNPWYYRGIDIYILLCVYIYNVYIYILYYVYIYITCIYIIYIMYIYNVYIYIMYIYNVYIYNVYIYIMYIYNVYI